MCIGTYGHICVLLTGIYELCDSCNNLLPERMLESVEMNRMHVCLKGYKHQLQNDASWLFMCTAVFNNELQRNVEILVCNFTLYCNFRICLSHQ